MLLARKKGGKELEDFNRKLLEKQKRKSRSDITEAFEYRKFWESLVSQEVPKLGIINLVFKLTNEEVSRICEKLVCCVYIPEKAEVKQKLLYGAGAGIIHNDVAMISKVISGVCKEDFLYENMVAACRKDFRY